MKNCSPPGSNGLLSSYTLQDNCDCLCHFQEECKMNPQDRNILQNISPLHCLSSYHSSSPLSNRIQTSTDISSIKNMKGTMSSNCLCVCEKVCDCPCHCISCLCCPCVKDRQQTQSDTNDFYKNLYNQTKAELELEKRRNDRMKYDKEMNKNSFQNSEKEKKNLLYENEQLKNKLNDALSKLEQEEDKNSRRDQELFSFKQEELPKLQQSYENLIKKVKEDKDKQIKYLNNQMNNLSKENINLKYQLQRKQDNERATLERMMDELNNEISDLKNELENKNRLMDELKHDNEELNDG